MRLALAILLSTAGFAIANPEEHDHRHNHPDLAGSSKALIEITINPEARVSVARGGNPPPRATCGHALELPVRIINRGFVTASIEAKLIDVQANIVKLEFSAEPLRGTPEEHRALRVTLMKPGLLDVTISFRAKNDISDLGGRDRIHLLLQCDA